MKISLPILLFLPFISIAGDPATITPEQPVLREQVTIYYDPSAERAVLRQPDEIDLYALFWYPEEDPVFRSYPMKESNGTWKVSFSPDDEKLRGIQFKFVSGELSDNNNDTFWDFPFHDKDGNILHDGYYTIGRSWLSMMIAPIPGLEMFREMDPVKAGKYFAQELENNPGHKDAGIKYIQMLSWQLRDAEDPEEIKMLGLTAIEKLGEQFSDDPDVLASMITAYRAFGKGEKATDLQAYLRENRPDHSFVVSNEMNKIFQARDEKERSVELARTFLVNYPDAEHIDQIVNFIYLPNLIALDKIDEAVEWIDRYEKPTPAMYWHLANYMLRENIDPVKIVPIAKRALTLFESHPPIEKPPFATDKDWENHEHIFVQMEIGLPSPNFYHTYATALWRNDEIDPALEYIQNAYDIAEGNNPRVNTRYVEILHSAGKYEEALEAGRKAIIANQAEPELMEQLEITYAALHESDEGFPEFVENARLETVVSLRGKFAERLIEKEAPDFTLVQLDGGEVTLSELEGKVVVIDFWATWCGPCVSAFPHFQRVVDHFADNHDVVFLAINTWEGEYDDERIGKVRNFIEENEYTFTILFDEDTVVSEYGVQGIPTRFTLDRNGVIRFQDVGFSGPGMFNDMVVQIEMLLEGYEPLTEL
jgi:thiol-disulfide isomerase/thioredoxin